MEFSTPTDAALNSPDSSSPDDAVNKIQLIVEEATEAGKPLEVAPFRERLFAVFAAAYTAGQTGDEGSLSADELTRLLGQRWGLDQSAQKSIADQQKLGEADLVKMRMLWSTLRLWMEWDYAWSRWSEFNDSTASPRQPR